MKKLIFAILLLFLIIPLVSSAPPITSEFVGDTGIQIELVAPVTIPVSTTVNVTVHTFNKSDGLLLDNGVVSCEGMIVNPNGILITQQTAGIFSDHYYFTLNETMATTPGIYPYTLHCNTSDIGGFKTSFFDVTTNGFEEKDPGLLIISAVVVLISLILLLIYLSTIIIPYGAKSFTLKTLLIVFATIFEIVLVGFTTSSLKAYLTSSIALSGFFGSMFTLLVYSLIAVSFLLAFVLVMIIYNFYKQFRGVE